MDIIPVLDVMNGRVVQGERGDRHRYRPIESVLVRGSEPLSVASALIRETHCRALYLADLDAIEGTGDNHAVIRDLRRHVDVWLWVDAAVTDLGAANRLLHLGATRVVVGTETLRRLSDLRHMVRVLSVPQLLVSLDVGAHGVLSACAELRGRAPLQALAALHREGVTQVLLLTLDRVGTGAGPALAELRAAKAAFPDIAFVAGGGVRTSGDLSALELLGVEGVLVATALHRGWIRAAELRGQGNPS